jgi:hypothetical protein
MAPPPGYLDPRGPRFGAWLTTAVLALVILTRSPWLAAAQTLVFAAGAVLGLSRAPYGVLYRRLLAPRLGLPGELEAELPPRFAQAVGTAFGVVATLGLATGATAVGLAAASLALAAAFLNAAFAFCMGCEVLLLARRVLGRAEITRFVTTTKGASA